MSINKKIADKARDSNLSLPKLQQDQYLSSNINAIEQKSDNELSVYERIRKMTSKKDFDDNNNSEEILLLSPKNNDNNNNDVGNNTGTVFDNNILVI